MNGHMNVEYPFVWHLKFSQRWICRFWSAEFWCESSVARHTNTFCELTVLLRIRFSVPHIHCCSVTCCVW